jgi:hypothetical protein
MSRKRAALAAPTPPKRFRILRMNPGHYYYGDVDSDVTVNNSCNDEPGHVNSAIRCHGHSHEVHEDAYNGGSQKDRYNVKGEDKHVGDTYNVKDFNQNCDGNGCQQDSYNKGFCQDDSYNGRVHEDPYDILAGDMDPYGRQLQ